jgi:hypothetical protein
MNFPMDTIDYCEMTQAASAQDGYEESNFGDAKTDDNYDKPVSTRRDLGRNQPQEYTTLRESKLDERNYMQMEVQNRAPEAPRSAKGKKNSVVWPLCCIVLYVTLTFLITSSLLAYTIWNVVDLRNNKCDCPGGNISTYVQIAEIQRIVSTLNTEMVEIQGSISRDCCRNYTREVERLEQSLREICSFTHCTANCHSGSSQCTVSIHNISNLTNEQGKLVGVH